MSHDSVFVSDSPSSEANDGLASSQDSLHGKVKSLQVTFLELRWAKGGSAQFDQDRGNLQPEFRSVFTQR